MPTFEPPLCTAATTKLTRSLPALNARPQVLGQGAVHGAFAGFTGFTTGLVNTHYVYLPIETIIQAPRKVNPTGRCGPGARAGRWGWLGAAAAPACGVPRAARGRAAVLFLACQRSHCHSALFGIVSRSDLGPTPLRRALCAHSHAQALEPAKDRHQPARPRLSTFRDTAASRRQPPRCGTDGAAQNCSRAANERRGQRGRAPPGPPAAPARTRCKGQRTLAARLPDFDPTLLRSFFLALATPSKPGEVLILLCVFFTVFVAAARAASALSCAIPHVLAPSARQTNCSVTCLPAWDRVVRASGARSCRTFASQLHAAARAHWSRSQAVPVLPASRCDLYGLQEAYLFVSNIHIQAISVSRRRA